MKQSADCLNPVMLLRTLGECFRAHHFEHALGLPYRVVLLTAMLFLLDVAGSPATPAARVRAEQVPGHFRLVVGGDYDYPPYEYLDEKGRPTGYNVELTRAIAVTMGLDVEIRLGPWSEIRDALESGAIDVVPGMFYSPERDRKVDFSAPHTIVNHSVFARRGGHSIESVEALRGSEVIVMRGDIMCDYLAETGLTENIVTVDTQADALRLLASGKHDFALIARLPGLYWIKRLRLSNLVMVSPPILPTDYCYAVAEGRTELLGKFREGLAILKETGRYQEIYHKWLGALEPHGIPADRAVRLAGLILGPLLFLLAGVWLWSRTLQRRVHQRTLDLEEEIAERRRAESALKESEQSIRGLLNATTDRVLLLDLDGAVRGLNATAAYHLQRPLDESIGIDFFSLFPPELAKWRRRKAEEVFRTGEPLRFTDRDGDAVLDTVLSPVFDEAGRVARLAVFSRDVTARHEMEEALRRSETEIRRILEHSPDVILTVNRRGEIVSDNRAASRSRRDVPVGADVFSGLPEDVCARLQQALDETFENGRVVGFEHMDDEGGWWLTRLVPIEDKDSRTAAMVIQTDVTELRESEERFRTVTESISDAILVLDSEGIIRFVNPAAESLFEKKGKDLIGTKFSHLADAGEFNELEILCGAGRSKIAEVRSSEMEWQRGSALLASLRDITDRKRAEDAVKQAHNALEQRVMERTAELARTNERLRHEIDDHMRAERALFKSRQRIHEILVSISDGFYTLDAEWRFTYVNPIAAGMMQCSPEEMIGKVIWEEFPETVEVGFDKICRRVVENRQPESFEVFYNRLGAWFEGAVYPYSDGVSVYYRNVSERKRMEQALQESERRFRGLVEEVPVGISIISGDRLVFANPGFLSLFRELKSGCALRDLFESLYPHDREKAERFLRGADSRNGVEGDVDLRFQLPDDQGEGSGLRWGKCRASTIHYEGRDAILLTVVDITRAKQMEELVMVREKMASLGHVAAGIAHEIRNPLSGINVFLDGILENFEDPESASDVREIIAEAQNAAAKIESVIKRVLDFARPGPTAMIPKDLNRPVMNAVRLCYVSLRKAHVQVETNLAEDLPKVPIDDQGIEQVVLNLITNASEALYTSSGNKTIRVTTSMGEQRVILSVADSGPGIPAEIRHRIFDPFYTTKSYGSGIGLGLSKRIIADHGGSIEVVESDLGGAEFVITLPLDDAVTA